MTINPELSAKTIRKAGRTLPEFFSFSLKDEKVVAKKIFRILPEKRVVFLADWQNQSVVIKLFVDAQHASRHAKREQEGVQRMQAAGLATANILQIVHAIDWSAVIYRYLQNTLSLSQAYIEADKAQRLELLLRSVKIIARLHAAGFIHTDCHLGNFLLNEQECYVLDGDGIREVKKPIELAHNLAKFLVQFSELDNDSAQCALNAYREISKRDIQWETINKLMTEISAERVNDFVEKVMRDCTAVMVRKSFKRFTAIMRNEEERLHELFSDLDHAIAKGEILKAGDSATVARVKLKDGSKVIVKRYNIKSFVHRLERAFVTTRATHSWRNAHRLTMLGIETAAPLGILEEVFGGLHGRSFFVMEDVVAPNIAEYWQKNGINDFELNLVKNLFSALRAANLYHGDFKATNILRTKTGLCLIDLDSMRVELSPIQLELLHKKDIERFKKNFLEQAEILNALNNALQ